MKLHNIIQPLRIVSWTRKGAYKPKMPLWAKRASTAYGIELQKGVFLAKACYQDDEYSPRIDSRDIL